MARPLTVACLQTRPMPDFDSAIGEVLPLAGTNHTVGVEDYHHL